MKTIGPTVPIYHLVLHNTWYTPVSLPYLVFSTCFSLRFNGYTVALIFNLPKSRRSRKHQAVQLQPANKEDTEEGQVVAFFFVKFLSMFEYHTCATGHVFCFRRTQHTTWHLMHPGIHRSQNSRQAKKFDTPIFVILLVV